MTVLADSLDLPSRPNSASNDETQSDRRPILFCEKHLRFFLDGVGDVEIVFGIVARPACLVLLAMTFYFSQVLFLACAVARFYSCNDRFLFPSGTAEALSGR